MEILFKECQSPGYKARTMINASADVTIAIAADFSTAGEICTRNCVKSQNKLYLDVDIRYNPTMYLAQSIVERIGFLNKIGISLNIAGNGIYTLKNQMNQSQVDEYVYTLLQEIDKSLISARIQQIVTGGQTGVDEAGAKAGIKLGIPVTILAPRGWLFRDITGKDIASEELFKARFK